MGNLSRGFIEAVDAFMAQPKSLVHDGLSWHMARDEGGLRLKLPLEVSGELSGQFLFIDAYPESRTMTFNMGIMFWQYVVCRLDYDSSTHSNRGDPSLPPSVQGPHWHSWEINRPLFKLYKKDRFMKLTLAKPFDSPARTFDSILRWHCSERKIALGQHQIEYPKGFSLL